LQRFIDVNIYRERANEIYDAIIIEGATVDGKTFEELAGSARRPSELPLTVCTNAHPAFIHPTPVDLWNRNKTEIQKTGKQRTNHTR
jgi:hypothetical protein